MIAKWLPQSSLEWPTSVPFSQGRFGEQASMISCHSSPVAHLQKCTRSMWERDIKWVKEREREHKRETDLKSSRTAWGNVWKLLFRLIWLWSLRPILPNICGVRKTLPITNRVQVQVQELEQTWRHFLGEDEEREWSKWSWVWPASQWRRRWRTALRSAKQHREEPVNTPREEEKGKEEILNI